MNETESRMVRTLIICVTIIIVVMAVGMLGAAALDALPQLVCTGGV